MVGFVIFDRLISQAFCGLVQDSHYVALSLFLLIDDSLAYGLLYVDFSRSMVEF